MGQHPVRHKFLVASITLAIALAGVWALAATGGESSGRSSDFLRFSAPAGNRPASADTLVDGVPAAILPSGRLVTPAGVEVNVQAPKPFGLALSPDGSMLATLNSGAAPFSLTLITQINGGAPVARRIDVNARVVAGRTAGSWRLDGNLLFQKPLSSERDAVDMVTSVGWTHRLTHRASLGVEALGEDLEGSSPPAVRCSIPPTPGGPVTHSGTFRRRQNV